jgi:hypothetical protein
MGVDGAHQAAFALDIGAALLQTAAQKPGGTSMATRKSTPAPAANIAALNAVENSPMEKVKVAVSDIDGVMRGKYLHKDKFMSAAEGGFGFCDVVFGWDMNLSLCRYLPRITPSMSLTATLTFSMGEF